MEPNLSSRLILEISSTKLRDQKFGYKNNIEAYIAVKISCKGVPPTTSDITEIKTQLDKFIDALVEKKRQGTSVPPAEGIRQAEEVVINKKLSSITGGWLQGIRIEPSPPQQPQPQQLQLQQNKKDDMGRSHLGNQEANLDIDVVPGDRMYDAFLNFNRDLTSETRTDYIQFKRSDANEYLKIVAIAVWIGFGASLVQLHALTLANGTYVAALVAALMALLASFASLVHATASILARHEMPCGCNAFYDFAEVLLVQPHGRWVENALVLSGQLAASLLLLADATESRGQHHHTELPPDLTVACMTIVLLSQIFCKGASNTVVALSWVISIVITNVCLSLIGSNLYFWINAVYLFLLMISYELERQTLRHFIKSILAVDVTEHNADLQIQLANQQVQLANQQIREGEQSLEAKRSVVRHVGHEIRG